MADPAAGGPAGTKLYLNEFGAEADGPRWDALYALVVRLKGRGVPIDEVGFQSHIHEAGDHIDPAVLRSHIAALAELGLSARISEIDVYGESPRVQATQFAGVLGACLSEPTCTSFSTWGITDRYGSTAEHDSCHTNGRAAEMRATPTVASTMPDWATVVPPAGKQPIYVRRLTGRQKSSRRESDLPHAVRSVCRDGRRVRTI